MPDLEGDVLAILDELKSPATVNQIRDKFAYFVDKPSINRVLYALEKMKLLTRTTTNPPLWSRVRKTATDEDKTREENTFEDQVFRFIVAAANTCFLTKQFSCQRQVFEFDCNIDRLRLQLRGGKITPPSLIKRVEINRNGRLVIVEVDMKDPTDIKVPCCYNKQHLVHTKTNGICDAGQHTSLMIDLVFAFYKIVNF